MPNRFSLGMESSKKSLDNVVGQIHRGVSTRKSLNLLHEHMSFVSQFETKSIHEAFSDNH